MANQVRCYCFIVENNVPVRGAIISCRRCSDNRVRFARTDIFGVAVFNLPDGVYLFRCECVPNFLTPSLEEYCVTLNPCYCSADLLFPCRLAALNTTPINITSNVVVNPPSANDNFNSAFQNTPETVARALGLNPSNTSSNSFFSNEAPGFYAPSDNTATAPSPASRSISPTAPPAAQPRSATFSPQTSRSSIPPTAPRPSAPRPSTSPTARQAAPNRTGVTIPRAQT